MLPPHEEASELKHKGGGGDRKSQMESWHLNSQKEQPGRGKEHFCEGAGQIARLGEYIWAYIYSFNNPTRFDEI